MSTKNTRSGGKFVGKHTTVIDAACEIADIADRCSGVSKISLGFIVSNLSHAPKSIKIVEEQTCLLLKIRGSTTLQEMRIFSKRKQSVKHYIQSNAGTAGFLIRS